MSDFFQKYKHPKWQAKRLSVLERDKFTCQQCRSAEKTLHVHHKIYRKSANPWDYADSDLITLCEDCHDAAGECAKALKEAIAQMHPSQVERLLGVAEAMVADDACQAALDRAGREAGYEQLTFPIRGFDHLMGYVLYFGTNVADGIPQETVDANSRTVASGAIEARGYLTIDELLDRKFNGDLPQ